MVHFKVRGGLASFFVATALILSLPSQAGAQASNSGTGLVGEYFDNFDLSGTRANRVDAQVNTLEFNAGPGPLPALPLGSDDSFIVRWQGMIEGPDGSAGTINLTFITDDGGRMWIDGVLVMDFWRQGAIGTLGTPQNARQTVPVTIGIGQKKHIRLEMYEQGGNDGAALGWTHAGQASIVAVPALNLYPELAAPRIVPAGGVFTDSTVVRIESDNVGNTGSANEMVVIRYSTNGTDLALPTDGIGYTGPFVLSATTTLKVRVFRGIFAGPSAQVQASFNITDAKAPRVNRIQSVDDQALLVTFSEPVTLASANTAANYALTTGTVTAAAIQPNLVSVRLTTTGLVAGADNRLSFPNGMSDRATPANLMAAGAGNTFTHRPPLKTNLVDWYRFDEGTGTTTADSSGNATGGGNGTLQPTTVDSPIWGEGVIGSALYFNGYNNEVTVSALEGILGKTCSMTVWVKTQAVGWVGGTDGQDVHGIVGTSDSGGANDIKYLYLDSSGKLVSRTGNGAVVSGTTISDNAWHLMAMTRDSATGNIEIFVDGVSKATGASEAGDKTLSFNAIGRLLGTATTTQRWLGWLDEVRFYSSVITANDVVDMYNTAPTVDAGPDKVVNSGSSTTLATAIGDDGFPAPPSVTYTWTTVSAPPGGVATIANPSGAGTGNVADTNVSFNLRGTYVLRLTANDGLLKFSDDVTIDLPTFVVTPTSGLTTTEAAGAGHTAQFSVKLPFQPANDVQVTLDTDDATQGTPDVTTLVFLATTGTPYTIDTVTKTGTGSWDVAHTVTVTDADDGFKDPAHLYHIVFNPATSIDTTFDGVTPSQVTLTSIDNDTPGITITPVAGLVTSEAGLTDTFLIKLNAAPQPGVTIRISIAPLTAGEVTTDVDRLDFLPATGTTYSIGSRIGTGSWNEDHIVTVSSIDDIALDFTQNFTIVTGDAVAFGGTDTDYNGMTVPDVQGASLDNEQIPTLKKVWGCGLSGVEILLPLGLIALWRRRRRNT
jgi:hypothetical protein